MEMSVSEWERKIREVTKSLMHDRNALLNSEFHLKIEDKEDPQERLYNAGYVLVDTEETNYLESYCIALLQWISGNFQCKLSFEDIPRLTYAKEWKLLTSALSDKEKSMEFLQKISDCIYSQQDSEISKVLQSVADSWLKYGTKTSLPCIFERKPRICKITQCIKDYFSCNFEANIITNLAQFDPNNLPCTSECQNFLLYEENDLFHAIVKRKIAIPDPEERALAIVEDIRNFPTFTRHFDNIFRLQNDLCANHVLMKNLLEKVENCSSVTDIMVALSTEIKLENVILDQLLDCFPELSFSVVSQIVTDLKSIIATSLGASMQQLIKAERDLKKRKEKEAKTAKEEGQAIMADLVKQMKKALDELEKMKTKRNNEIQMQQRLQQELSKLEVVNNLKSKLTQIKPTNSEAFRKLPTCLNAHMLVKVLVEAYDDIKIHPHLLTLDKDAVMDIVKHSKSLKKYDVDKNFPQKYITITANHLSISHCLGDVVNLLFKYQTDKEEREKEKKKKDKEEREKEKKKKDKNDTFQINFIGKETLVIDTSLPNDVFHGINLTFASKYIYVEATDVVSIDVSGENGQEHASLKPVTPTAFDAPGNNGDPGDYGESGGNVFLYASKQLVGLENLSVKSNGGKGARGQDGGDGGQGSPGNRGKDGVISETSPTARGERKEYSPGQPGTTGNSGAISGKLGIGGRGGFGGRISIQVQNNLFEIDATSKNVTRLNIPIGNIGNIESQNGDNGDNGNPGNGGIGGLGGAHGNDAAWYTKSAWFFDPWIKKQTGTFVLEPFAKFLRNGFIVKILPNREDADEGNRGDSIDQINKDNCEVSRKKNAISLNAIRSNISHTERITTNQNVRNIRQEVSSDQDMEIARQQHYVERGQKSMTELDNSLQKLETFEEEKQRECQQLDDLSEKVKEITREYHHRFISLQHQNQNIIVTDNKLLNGLNELLQPTNSNIATVAPNSKLVYNDLESSFEDLNNILTTQENYKNSKALESYIQGFLQHKDEFPNGVKTVLKKMVKALKSKQKFIGGFEILEFTSQIFPSACLVFNKCSVKHFQGLPFVNTKDVTDVSEVLYNFCDRTHTREQLQEMESFVLKRFGGDQRAKLLFLMEPKWIDVFVPDCLKALSEQSGYLPSSGRQLYDRFFGTNSKNTEKSEEQRLICVQIMKKVLTLQRELLIIKSSKPDLFTDNVLSILVDVLKTNKDIDSTNYTDEIFQNVLHHNFTNIIGALKKATTVNQKRIRMLFYKVEFILQNFEYSVEQLTEISKCTSHLESNYMGDLAVKLKTITDSMYTSRFQLPIITKIFEQLKNIQGLDDKKTELVDIIELFLDYDDRMKELNRFLESCQKPHFVWSHAIDVLKTDTECTPKGLKESIETINKSLENEKITTDYSGLMQEIKIKLLHCKCNLIELKELKEIEKESIKLFKWLNKPKSPIEIRKEKKAYQNNLRNFWDRQLQDHLTEELTSSIKNRELKYQEWSQRIENLIEELAESTMIYEKEHGLAYLQLKLNQVTYWAKSEGRLNDLEKMVFGSKGDELERLKHIMEVLHTFKIPAFEDFENEIGNTLVKAIDEITKLNNFNADERNAKYFNLFTCVSNLIIIPDEEVIKKIIKAIEVKLVKHWKNDETLEQFNKQLNVHENPIKNLAQVCTSKRNFIRGKLREKNPLLKNILVDFIDTIEDFVNNKHEKLQLIFARRIIELENNKQQATKTLLPKCKEHLYYFVSSADYCKSETTPCTTHIEKCRQNLFYFERLQDIVMVEENSFRSVSRQCFDSPWWLNTCLKSRIEIGDSWLPFPNNFVRDDTIHKILPEKVIPSESLLKECIFCTTEELKTISQNNGNYIYQNYQILESSWDRINFSEDKNIAKLRLLSRVNEQAFKTSKAFWKLSWEEISQNIQPNKIAEIFLPYLKNPTRLLISRLISHPNRVFSDDKIYSLFQYFENNLNSPTRAEFENNLSKEDETKLKSLLNKEEKDFANLCSSLPIGDLRSTLDWTNAIQHHWLQEKYKELSIGQSDEEKKQLADILTIWSEKMNLQGRKNEYNRWVELLVFIARMVKLFPISFCDMKMFFGVCADLPLESIEKISKERLPMKYVEAALLTKLERNFVQKYPNGLRDGKIESFLDNIRTFIYNKNKDVVQNFLLSFAEQTNESIPKLDTFEKLFHPDTHKTNGEEFLSKISNSHFSKWNWISRTMFYKKLLIKNPDNNANPDDDQIVELAVEVELKYLAHTEKFVELYVKKFGLEILTTLTEFLTNLKNGVWILNEEMMKKFKASKKVDKVKEKFAKYMKTAHTKDLVDVDLINRFAELEMNSEAKRHKDELLEDLREIHKKLAGNSELLSEVNIPINMWTAIEINEFSKKIKKERDINGSSRKTEVLAVICRGVELTFEKKLRDTQLTSILLFINGIREHKGIFGEIATSEGKTLISASFAIFLALTGHNVNIITSSPVLAIRASKENRELFNLFGIGVANICDDICARCRKGGPEEPLWRRYGNQVLYGNASSFETDFLHTKFLGKEYTRNRGTPYLIVDEVDSMLLDKATNVLYISHNVPELRWLRKIFVDIWGFVKCSMSKVAIDNRIRAKYIDGNGLLKFPKFLRPFVENRIPIWINNAFTALEMDENVPYVIDQGEKVTIIDLDTGIEQDSMQYSFGLHQFLQLKHGNKISSESLKAIYCSNLGYFRQFQGKIFGISGTLGDDYSRKILSDLYCVEFFKMPRFRYRTCIKEPAIFCNSTEDFLKQILNSVNNHKETQPSLLICEDRKSATEIYKYLEQHLDLEARKNLISYVSSQENSTTEKVLTAGYTIISTNLAGRGTDFDIAEDCEAGLHVILTYLPPNKRVGKQAFGRTARAGRKGSTQYIVMKPLGIEINDINVYHDEMALAEKKRLERFVKRDVPRIELEEKLLEIFFSNMDNLKQAITQPKNLKENEGMVNKIQNKMKYAAFQFTTCPSKAVLNATLEILKNAWAFWLDDVQHDLQTLHLRLSEKDLEKELTDFFVSLANDVMADKFCKTPSDYVKLAKAYDEVGKYEKAANVLESGLEIEDNYNEICHYYLGVCLLKRDSKSKSKETRKAARQHFKTANLKIKDRIQELTEVTVKLKSITKMDSSQNEQNTNDENISKFTEQTNNEIELLRTHIREFLDPVLGYNISPRSFLCLPSVNQDEKESEAIFDAIKNEEIIKGLRISKKVTDVAKIEFEDQQLKTFEPGIKNILDRKIKDKVMEVSDQDFKDVVMTREKFWNRLVEEKFVENVEEITEIEVNYDEDKFVENFNQFPVQKLAIGKLLSENNLKTFTEDLFNCLGLQETLLDKLIEELEGEGHLVKRKHFKGKIVSDIYKQLKMKNEELTGVPESLLPYLPILYTWITAYDDVSEKRVPVKELDTRKLIKLPHDSISVEKEDIINQLVSERVLKTYKVRWSLGTYFGNEETQKERINAVFNKSNSSGIYTSLKNVFETYHQEADEKKKEKDFEKYLTEIQELLINSVGLVKTLPKLTVSSKYRSILDSYSGSSIPPEAHDLQDENFDRIPDVVKKVPWWSTGAALVALFGVLQIAVGVTIAVVSGGTLANVSMMFISEGGSDIMFAIQSGLTGNFSWKTYAAHKVFSVGASILTGGLGGITGASFANIVLMEVAEEIGKKIAWTVGRYALQGAGSTLMNMTIEKALDSLRQSVVSKFQEAAQFYMTGDQEYCAAKRNLAESLKHLHAASYRPGQVEDVAKNARSELGPENSNSALSNAFSTAMQRVAYFYTSKITEQLSSAFRKGIVQKVSQLVTHLLKLASPIVTRFKEAIKKFALNYVQQLTNHFNRQAEVLRQKQNLRVTHVQQTAQHQFQNFSTMYMSLIDNDVLEDGLKKFQQEYAEPTLKQMGNRWLDSKCHSKFKGLQADYTNHVSYTSEGNKEGQSLWHKLSNPSKHYAMEMNTRLNIDDKIGRNNVWDHVGGGRLSDLKDKCGDFIRTSPRIDGTVSTTFMLSEESRHLLEEVEGRGILVVRRFVL